MHSTQHRSNIRALRRIGVISAVATVIALIPWAGGYRWNSTDSLPRGVWHITRHALLLERGQIAFFCPPATEPFRIALEREYLDSGGCPAGTTPMFKPVVALPGDVVTVAADGIRVNGADLIANSQAIRIDGAGRAMPMLEDGPHLVPAGHAWFVSSHSALSYDSRYFGALPMHIIDGRATPIWVGSSQ